VHEYDQDHLIEEDDGIPRSNDEDGMDEEDEDNLDDDMMQQ